jgi:hypothetical protein
MRKSQRGKTGKIHTRPKKIKNKNKNKNKIKFVL